MDVPAAPAALTALAAGAVARLRAAPALHPRGTVHECTVQVSGSLRTGCRLLDEPATHSGVSRLSRSAGLPPPLPDVGGLAVRLPGLGRDGGPLDLLLSTAWRFVFVPSVVSRTASSLVPFRTGTGRLVMLGARPDGGGFDLLVASPTGPWRSWGRLSIGGATADQDLRTEPWRGAADLVPVAYLRRLRRWSYAASQASRPGLTRGG